MSFLAAAAFCMSFLQQTPVKPRFTASSVLSDSRPVTCSEGFIVFTRARLILSRKLGLDLGRPVFESSQKPLTRDNIVHEMAAISVSIGPKVKFVPRPVAFNPSRFRIASTEVGELKRLVALGYVGKVGPLATGPSGTLNLTDFGDALGFFLSRASELTHMPSPDWSPILGAGG